MATITSKGQITIPAAVRESFDLHAGDQLEFFRALSGDLAVRIRRRRHGAGRAMVTAGRIDLSRKAVGEAVASGVSDRRSPRPASRRVRQT